MTLHFRIQMLCLVLLAILGRSAYADNPVTLKDQDQANQAYGDWAHSGSLFILTTPEGADLPTGLTVTNFPLLVRLDKNNFDFTQLQPDGRDLRFTDADGIALSFQIENWQASEGTASVWVKIPLITGNSTQEIRMFWGNSGAANESNGKSVFNAENGYASVIHMDGPLRDSASSIVPTNSGTTVTTGMIGNCRRFIDDQGIHCGSTITSLPGRSGPFSTQAWVRPQTVNTTVLGWGVEQAQGKIVMQLPSPLHVSMDCYFGGANVKSTNTLPVGDWIHIVHTYQSGSARLYVNGALSGTNSEGTMNVPRPAKLEIGGWNQDYDFQGEIDEVRISNVVRSAHWIKLEYENQKPLQTLVGTLVQDGTIFAASPPSGTIDEGTDLTLTGEAGGALKVYWISNKNGQESVLATDRFSVEVPAGRVSGNQSLLIQFKAIYPNSEVRNIDIPITIQDTIPDPTFTITAPLTWNGRDAITVAPDISNLPALQAANAAKFNETWSVNGVAVVKKVTPGLLTLLRSQGAGPMTVTLTLDNGGLPISSSKTIIVQEPPNDPWLERSPLTNEKPVNFQFFARNPTTGLGTIYYRGTQATSADEVYLKIYTTDTGTDIPYGNAHYQNLVGNAYSFVVPIAAGKSTYKLTFGTRSNGVDSDPLATVSDLICGDAFIIEGQSNALATDNSEPNDPTTDPWIRSYGLTSGWGGAVSKGGERQLGLWGWYLAKRLSADNNMPICIINGAVGGTRIDQHQPNPSGRRTAGSSYAIYANLYNRTVGARLTHGIRGVFWHQGEQNQGSGGPNGDYDYKFYQQYFVDMSAAWKQDFPNLLNYYVFQIWPAACGDTSRNDQLREVQRTLPRLYSNLRMMSTVGIVPGSSCHYLAAGYQQFADLIGPVVEQDSYGLFPSSVFTAANLNKAYFSDPNRNEITLEFDQKMDWYSGASKLLFLDGMAGKITSGKADENLIRLKLSESSSATSITYLKGTLPWNQGDLLYGSNGVAALTFADVPIDPPPTPYSRWSTDPARGLTLGKNAAPLDDPDGDCIVNLLEFVLGGNPVEPSLEILPSVMQAGGETIFQYQRSDLSAPPATIQTVEYGSDLIGWTPVSIPRTSAGTVTITPGARSDRIHVALPDLGPTGFIRLKVTE
jgi:hypothetical protein